MPSCYPRLCRHRVGPLVSNRCCVIYMLCLCLSTAQNVGTKIFYQMPRSACDRAERPAGPCLTMPCRLSIGMSLRRGPLQAQCEASASSTCCEDACQECNILRLRLDPPQRNHAHECHPGRYSGRCTREETPVRVLGGGFPGVAGSASLSSVFSMRSTKLQLMGVGKPGPIRLKVSDEFIRCL
jgi:hypothetical protein